MPFFAVSGLRVQGDALRSGGQRRIALPESGPDPTDADAVLAAFLARRRELSGERRLVLAVIMTALDDLRRYPRGSKLHTDASRWLLSNEARWPMAFRPCCETLDLDASAVRHRVLEALAGRVALGTVATRGHVYRGRAPAYLCSVA